MEQQLEVAVMEPNVDHGHPIMNLGMEVLPGIAFPCQGSHQEEPATMIPKMDYALKELIVAMVSALPHAQPQQLLQQQLPLLQLLLQLPLQQLLLLLLQQQQRLKNVSLMEPHVGRTWLWSTKEFAVPL